MTLYPILTAGPEVQLHVAAAMVSIVLGPFALYLRQGTRLHRSVGYGWVLAMMVLSLSSFGIHGFGLIGPFSPLHGLALLTLWSLWQGVRYARAGAVAAHRRVFRNLYWGGVMAAGLFSLLPGRALNRAVLTDMPPIGYLIIGLGLSVVAVALVPSRTRRLLRKTQASG
jgi:uncharacterized membrane protein